MLAMFFPLSIYAQAFLEISGKVNAQGTQEPLDGCHVYIHEDFGTITDEEGNFQIKIPYALANDQLRVTYMGYKEFVTSVYDLDGGFLEVNLEEDAIMLESVVVVADPWMSFRESVERLTGVYSDKHELYAEILVELGKIDPQFEKSIQIRLDETMNNE